MGYDFLADMRTKRNPNIIADEYEREWQSAFYELYGYWYPNGGRNSLIYIAITNEESSCGINLSRNRAMCNWARGGLLQLQEEHAGVRSLWQTEINLRWSVQVCFTSCPKARSLLKNVRSNTVITWNTITASTES